MLNILLKCCLNAKGDCKQLIFPTPCSIVSLSPISACRVLLKRNIIFFLKTEINLKGKTLTIVRTALLFVEPETESAKRRHSFL